MEQYGESRCNWTIDKVGEKNMQKVQTSADFWTGSVTWNSVSTHLESSQLFSQFIIVVSVVSFFVLSMTE